MRFNTGAGILSGRDYVREGCVQGDCVDFLVSNDPGETVLHRASIISTVMGL